ncbi:MAG: hypothetical protein FWE40_05520 [Oscillospiraceae bacterium]|nr:hypothetical protein [Oscillospiraceae bacterium]
MNIRELAVQVKERKVQRLKDKRDKLKRRASGVKAEKLRRIEIKLAKAKRKLREAQRMLDAQLLKRGQGRDE